jgi:hypothetical protein
LIHKARLAADILLFSAVYPDVKAAVRGDNRNMAPPTADRFQLVNQSFTPGDRSFAVHSGGSIHVGQIGNLTVTRPWDLGGIGLPDDDLLQGLRRLFRRNVKADIRERVARSLEWFRLAHASGDAASALTKLVMMTTAFEILLQIPEGLGKTAKFIQAIESRLRRPQTKSETRLVPVKVGKKKGSTKSVTRSLPGWWADDFYDLRSRVVHGDPINLRRLKYKRWPTHLIVADVVFGECLVKELYDLRLFGHDIRRCSRRYDRLCPDQPSGWHERDLKDWLLGDCETHEQLGWLPKHKK